MLAFNTSCQHPIQIHLHPLLHFVRLRNKVKYWMLVTCIGYQQLAFAPFLASLLSHFSSLIALVLITVCVEGWLVSQGGKYLWLWKGLGGCSVVRLCICCKARSIFRSWLDVVGRSRLLDGKFFSCLVS